MPLTAKLGGSGFTEEERSFALQRFHTLRPFLEDGVPLARIDRETPAVVEVARESLVIGTA
jgi:hypothetical protein